MTNSPITERMISDYCRKRIAPHMAPGEVEAIRRYVLSGFQTGVGTPRSKGRYDWEAIGMVAGVGRAHLETAARHLEPLLDAVRRSMIGRTASRAPAPEVVVVRAPLVKRPSLSIRAADYLSASRAVTPVLVVDAPADSRRYRRRIVEELPTPLWTEWEDPDGFADALRLHIKRHGDSVRHLYHAVGKRDQATNHTTIRRWVNGELTPRSIGSLEILRRIEHRYRLPEGYFKSKLPYQSRGLRGHHLEEFSPAERRRLAWHLPDDFNSRSPQQQEEILDWVKRVIISGGTEYRAFHAAAIKNRYSVRFRAFQGMGYGKNSGPHTAADRSSVVDAPPELEKEIASLLTFKTSTLTQLGLQRAGVWGDETASQKVEHLGLMFGAFVASPDGAARGYGADLRAMCMAMLVFPKAWDWYLQWREQRRGFYTSWEVNMLALVASLVKSETGWIRQTPALADRLQPIHGLIAEDDIASARLDWAAACDQMYRHARQRLSEIERVAKVHRDPFEPILPILEADSPVREYRRITDEILRLMPDERLHPRQAAESVRSFLMLRIGLHTGLRQKNLRELRVCRRGGTPKTERQLEELRCGELRWSDRDSGWELLIPSAAFKNASSSFFGQKPFRLVLPDLAMLYEMIDAYLDRHRERLLASAEDPGTFFIKTVKQTSASPRYDQTTFYDAWRLIIQRYGIFNPYTGRGAIRGLLPHGPHNIRDVLATHILKKTGSFEQASYAIQDTPAMIAEHYGRFLPEDKSALAARILNRVWDEE